MPEKVQNEFKLRGGAQLCTDPHFFVARKKAAIHFLSSEGKQTWLFGNIFGHE